VIGLKGSFVPASSVAGIVCPLTTVVFEAAGGAVGVPAGTILPSNVSTVPG
jgi:hypothetical protein